MACGQENNLNIRLFGTQGALEWHQEQPNSQSFTAAGRAAGADLARGARVSERRCADSRPRVPGHPEDYIEAFATLYRLFIADLRRCDRGSPMLTDYPDLAARVRGLKFIAAALESSRRNLGWMALD